MVPDLKKKIVVIATRKCDVVPLYRLYCAVLVVLIHGGQAPS